jgi:hypothetical protein
VNEWQPVDPAGGQWTVQGQDVAYWAVFSESLSRTVWDALLGFTAWDNGTTRWDFTFNPFDDWQQQ